MDNFEKKLRAVKQECGNYGMYKIQAHNLNTELRYCRERNSDYAQCQRKLDAVNRRIYCIEEMMRKIEETSGAQAKMLVWRLLVAKEDIRKVAAEKQVEPIMLELEVETCIFEGIFEDLMNDYRVKYA